MQKRLFISLPVDDNWKKIFQESLNGFISNEHFRITASGDLHITLFFLGSVDEELIPEIEDALRDIATRECTRTNRTYADRTPSISGLFHFIRRCAVQIRCRLNRTRPCIGVL